MRRAVAVLAAVVATSGLVAGPAAAQEAPTLAARGDGRAFLVPDQAELYVAVERVRATSRAARASASRQVVRLQRALRRQGVAAADVRTSGISVSRERVRRRDRPARVRYRAATQLEVLARDVRRLGALIDVLADAGADDIYGPDFSFSDPSQGVILATREALADARRRADDAAGRLGLRVTGVLSVDLDPAVLDLGGDDESGEAIVELRGDERTRVLPGRRAFSVTVRVVYALGPAT